MNPLTFLNDLSNERLLLKPTANATSAIDLSQEHSILRALTILS